MTTSVFAEDAVVSPYEELISLEALYAEDGASLKKVTSETVLKGLLPSEALRERQGMVPDEQGVIEIERLIQPKIGSFSVAVNGTPGWPEKLRDSARPTPLLYYRGDLNIIDSKSVSVVGSRKATPQGLQRARRLARELSERGVTVVTGLARGIDTAVAVSALEARGRTIGVIGTPIDEAYPKENKDLQEEVARNHLLVSQVPFYRYATESFRAHGFRFPERNELMAAISDATVIVEASDTSGTLSQARACLQQGRPLFLMRSLTENPDISWPKRFLGKEGVFVLDSTDQVMAAIGAKNG